MYILIRKYVYFNILWKLSLTRIATYLLKLAFSIAWVQWLKEKNLTTFFYNAVFLIVLRVETHTKIALPLVQKQGKAKYGTVYNTLYPNINEQSSL